MKIKFFVERIEFTAHSNIYYIKCKCENKT